MNIVSETILCYMLQVLLAPIMRNQMMWLFLKAILDLKITFILSILINCQIDTVFIATYFFLSFFLLVLWVLVLVTVGFCMYALVLCLQLCLQYNILHITNIVFGDINILENTKYVDLYLIYFWKQKLYRSMLTI